MLGLSGCVVSERGNESAGVLRDVAAVVGDVPLVPEVSSTVIVDASCDGIVGGWRRVEWAVDLVGEEWRVKTGTGFDHPVDVMRATRQDMHKLDGSPHGSLRSSGTRFPQSINADLHGIA